jgi:Carboxypeptidase regulatory-like domain/TonB dependent receptor
MKITAVCYLSTVFAGTLLAQNETAVLTGRVLDPSGSGVARAQLRLTGKATGAVRTSLSAEGGFYRFDLLPPGDYSIQATADGFKQYDDNSVHLDVARSSSLDIRLVLGAVAESVEVNAEVSPLVTASAAQGTVISSDKVREIPLNGRQFLQLALLSPGTNSGGLAVQQNSLRQGEIAGISVAGQRTNDSAYLLDGVMNTDPDYNALNYVPIVDSIAEFQVQVAQYSAEFGRASGGQINVLTQSGTRDWHGSAWDFLRNNVLDSRPFNLTTSPDVPEFRRNQFGGTLGGPLRKDKLFGFFSYEGLRNRQAGANLTTVSTPDALQRVGNFSEELPVTAVYDPNTLANGARTPFPGNVIPTNRINPSVLAAMAALPLPNVTGGFFINSGEVLQQNYDNVSARADYALSQNLRLFGRYSGATENASIPATLPDRAGLDNAGPRNAAFGLTEVISPTKVNDIRLGFSRLNFLFGLPEPQFQVSGAAATLPNFIAGQLNFGGAGPYNATGPGGIAQSRDNVYQAWDVFAWQLGRHSLRMGGEFDAFQYVRFEYADPLGSLTFTNGYTNATGAAPKATDKSGDALATALLGLPQTAVRTLGPNRIDGRQKNYAGFVQDDFRVSSTLTLNLGIRYELSPPLQDIRHQMSSIDFSTAPSPITIFATGQQGKYSPLLYVCGRDGYPDGCAATNWKNFSPRVGAAWAVGAKTVVRAGAGLYYGTQDDNTLLKLAQSLPTTYNQTLTAPSAYVPSSTISNVFSPAVVGSASIQAAAIDPGQGTPYSPQWSLNVQRELASKTVLEVGYLGTGGVHLEQNVQVNNSMPGTTAKRPYFGLTLSPAVQAALAFPSTATVVPVTTINYFPHSAHSNYHALLTRFERKFASGFSLLSSFTYGKALTNAPQYRNAGGITGNENSPPQNSFNLAADRSPAYFNTKLRWVTTALYELPFGNGKKMFGSGAGAAILGGWALSGTLQAQTGFPYTLNYKGDPINIGGGSGGILVRPNYALDANGQNVDPNLPADQRSTARYFNTAAFVQPVASFGDVGRNTMTGANLVNLDTTLTRSFRLGERAHLQARGEFFNLMNHPNYSLIGRVINDPTFGIVQNQLSPRQIQLALKFSF